MERLLKKVAEAKGKTILEGKEKKLPSPTFVTNYLQSFRPRPPPQGLEETAELDEESGKGQLRAGLQAMNKRTGEGYEAASAAFDKALELGELGEHEAFAYNMRGTFRYLRGENTDALEDLTRSVELQPSLTQSYIKRASMHLELGKLLRFYRATQFDQSKQETKTLHLVTSNKPWNNKRTIPTFTIIVHSSTLSSANSVMRLRITKSPLI